VPRDEARREKYLRSAAATVLGISDEDEEEEDQAAVGTVEDLEAEQPERDSDGEAFRGGSSYGTETTALFPLYRYLFLSGSKPVAHARAFALLDDASIRAACPATLKRLVLDAKRMADELHG
jgi:hypothetical protein